MMLLNRLGETIRKKPEAVFTWMVKATKCTKRFWAKDLFLLMSKHTD
jgi:hypothetical protein